jgi:hypothetical protein
LLGGAYTVRLSKTAIVVVHIATAYPTIVAVSALVRKTESKNASEI